MYVYCLSAPRRYRYVGGTGNNTVEAMRRAKGGVLMIDEAYAMLPHRNHFGGDVMQALLDNITTEEYKGKIIVILSGYKDDVEELFGLNPGFQGRFDKKRIEFPEWSGDMAARAVLNVVEREGKSMDEDARAAMTGYFQGLRNLPNWASARDAMEWIKPALDAARAERQFRVNQEKRALQSAKEGGEGSKSKSKSKSKAARAAMDSPLPYSLDDVRQVFTSAISARGGALDPATGAVMATAETTGSIRSLVSVMALREMQNSASRLKKLLVVLFTSPSTCRPCQDYEPLFDGIASENAEEVMFAKVYAEKGQSLFRKMDVQSVPHTMLFFSGAKTDEVLGCDPQKLSLTIQSHLTRQRKFQSNAPQPPPPPPSNLLAPPVPRVGAAPASAQPPLRLNEKEKDKVKVRVLMPDHSASDDSDSDDEPTEGEAWAALEDACAELGYTLEQLRDMLSDAATFPPKELMDLVLQKVGSKHPGRVKSMLQKQRPEVLVKVTSAIEEDKQRKTAEQQQEQERVQAVGKCPMGFSWHKEGAGWRCAGGSHYVTDDDIENYMYCSENMYG
jgi:thiol-disulfide isomerase/thioredoxin